MNSNFYYGILAITKDIKIFFLSTFSNKSFTGFVVGVIIAVLVIGFILTKNPKNIPLILRYPSAESFEKIASRDKSGTYTMSYTTFIKLHTQVRTLFLIAFISFCVMITTAALTAK